MQFERQQYGTTTFSRYDIFKNKLKLCPTYIRRAILFISETVWERTDCNSRAKKYVTTNPLSSKVISPLPEGDGKWQALDLLTGRKRSFILNQFSRFCSLSLSRIIRHSRWPGPKSILSIRRHLSANIRNQFAPPDTFPRRLDRLRFSFPPSRPSVYPNRIIGEGSPFVSVKNEGEEWCFTWTIKLDALFPARDETFILLTYVASLPVYVLPLPRMEFDESSRRT